MNFETIQETFKKTHTLLSSSDCEDLIQKFISLQQDFLVTEKPVSSTDICIPFTNGKSKIVFISIGIYSTQKNSQDSQKAAVFLCKNRDHLVDSSRKLWPIGSKDKPYQYLKFGHNFITLQAEDFDLLQFELYACNSERILVKNFQFIVLEIDSCECRCYPNEEIGGPILKQLTEKDKNLIAHKYQRQGDLRNLEVILRSIPNSQFNSRFIQFQLLRYKYYQKANYSASEAKAVNLVKNAKPQEASVLHLFKVVKYRENSGGAIRGHEILLSLKQLGLKNIVLLPPGRLDKNCNSQEYGSRLYPFFVNEESEAFYISWIDENYSSYSKPMRVEMLKAAAFRVAKFYKPSVVHAHSGFDGFDLACVGSYVAKKRDIPFIYEVRSFHESTWSANNKYKESSEHFSLRVAVENSYMHRADRVITICKTMKSKIVQRGVDEAKVAVIPNCVDTEKFNSESQQDKSLKSELGLGEKFVIGYLSNMHPREGHLLLVQALGNIIRAGHTDVHCLFVGKGTMETSIHSLVDDLNLQDYVTIYGEIENRKVVSAYNCYDLFVIPRVRDHAGNYVTPMKPFEAMSLGIPLLVSNLPALCEIAGDGERHAHLFEAGSVDDLAAKILALKNNYEQALRVARTAQKFIYIHHSRERLKCDYQKFYDFGELLEKQ